VRITFKYLVITLVFSLILAFVIFRWVPFYEIKGFNKALDGLLLISSISLGFYGACLSVFASLFNTKVVKEIMNDNSYRIDFLIISSVSLGIGILTVLGTIVYQVMLENGGVAENILRYTNSIWLAFVFMFFSFQLIFVVVSFSIFFKNSDKDVENDVYTPMLDGSKLNRKK
jgi:hypothetical protein